MAPWGLLAMSGDISIVVTDVCMRVRVCTCVCVCALTSSVQRPGMLLNIIQGTGHSLTAKNFLTPNIQGRGSETQLSMEPPVHRKVRGLGNKLKDNMR